MTLRVVIADDDPMVRTGLALILDAHSDLELAGEAADGEQALAVVAQQRPDIVLLDIRMPRMDGLAAARAMLARPDPPRVIMLTTFDLDEYVYAAISAGATGFLLKDASPERLVSAIRHAVTGDTLLAPAITRRLIERYARRNDPAADAGQLASLTAREREVLRMIAHGMTNAEIAASLHLGETTIKTHVGRILAKLSLRDRIQAVILAYETGLVQPGEP
jgi:DNA-binding NarL/FixJ family response regulator